MSGALQQCNKTFFHAQPFRSVNAELAVFVCAVFLVISSGKIGLEDALCDDFKLAR